MPKDLKTPFQHSHAMQYGLQVTKRDPRTNAVLAILCCFCLKFGSKAMPGAKQKCMNNVQMFKTPFRTDVYKKHHAKSIPRSGSSIWHAQQKREKPSLTEQSTMQAHCWPTSTAKAISHSHSTATLLRSSSETCFLIIC